MANQGFEFQKSLKEKNPYPLLRFVQVESYVTRPLASLVVRAVYRTRLTPNHLTIASLFVGIGGGAAYLGAGPGWFASAGLLVYLSSILDCADGMLARSRNQCTRFGLFLDLFCDRIVDFAILAGIALGYYFDSGHLLMSALALFNIGIYFLQVTLLYLMKQWQGVRKSGDASEARGLSLFIIMLLSLLNRLDLIILAVLATVVSSTVAKIIQLVRLSRAGRRPRS